MASFKNSLKSATLAFSVLGSACLFSTGASATYSLRWEVEADAGSFEPVVLGEDISLDACGSELLLANYPSWRSSICDVTNIALYSVNWFAKNIGTGAFSWLTGGLGSDEDPDLSTIPAGTAAANSQTTTATGSGSFFSSVGTYAIGVYVAGTNYGSGYETVSNGTYNFYSHGNFGPNFANTLSTAFSQNGVNNNVANNNVANNNGANWSSSFEVTAAVSVPEPESLFVLLPALVLLGMRERRRRKILPAV